VCLRQPETEDKDPALHSQSGNEEHDHRKGYGNHRRESQFPGDGINVQNSQQEEHHPQVSQKQILYGGPDLSRPSIKADEEKTQNGNKFDTHVDVKEIEAEENGVAGSDEKQRERIER
jgi:hypothetical protein